MKEDVVLLLKLGNVIFKANSYPKIQNSVSSKFTMEIAIFSYLTIKHATKFSIKSIIIPANSHRFNSKSKEILIITLNLN